MTRKILLSFLGTSTYVPCNYYIEQDATRKVENVKYIQEAIATLYCADFIETDYIYIFATNEAKRLNWLDKQVVNDNANQSENVGLQNCFKNNKSFKGSIELISINEGFSITEIWKIFEQVFSVLQQGDEVQLDITHGFRSQPMLGMVLLNYTKTLKGITVKAIHYGAFEKLGFGFKVKDMPMEDRNAPIINLLPLATLQDWTVGAQNFIKYGIADDIVALANDEKVKAIHNNEIDNISRDAISSITKSMQNIANNFRTNRGAEIISGKVFEDAKNEINSFVSKPNLLPQLHPVLLSLKNKIDSFTVDGNFNWLLGVEWCINHNLVQEGITQLQEGIISYLCILNKKDYAILKDREQIKDDLNTMAYNSRTNIVNEDSANNLMSSLANPFQSLTTLRNNINHGGYNPDQVGNSIPKAAAFKKDLINLYKAIKEICY